MKARRMPLCSIFPILFLLLGFYFNINGVGLSKDPARPFTLLEYSGFFIGILAFFIVIVFVERRFNRLRFKVLPLVIFLLLWIIQVIVILSAPEEATFTIPLSSGVAIQKTLPFPMEERLFALCSATVTIAMSWLFIAVLPRRFPRKKCFYPIFYLVIALTITAIGYSYITEARDYVYFFTHFLEGDFTSHAVKSFLVHKNPYALFLFLTIFIFLFFHHRDGKWYHWPIIAFLYINMLFTVCKALLLLSAILILSYLLGRFFLTYKAHRKRNLITLGIFLGLFLSGLIFLALVLTLPLPFFKVIREDFLLSGDAHLFYRLNIWRNDLAILSQTSWLFGAGIKRFSSILILFNCTNSPDPAACVGKNPCAHSGYLHLLGEGGIFMLIVALGYLVFLVHALIRIGRKDKSFVLLESIFLVILLFYMCIETYRPLFDGSLQYFLPIFLLAGPVHARYYALRHPAADLALLRAYEKIKDQKVASVRNRRDVSRAIFLFSTPLLAVYVGFVTTMFTYGTFMPELSLTLPFGISCIVLFFLYLLVPMLAQLIYDKVHHVSLSSRLIGDYLLKETLPWFMTFALYAGLVSLVVLLAGDAYLPDPSLLFAPLLPNFLLDVFPAALFVAFGTTCVYYAVVILVPALRRTAGSPLLTMVEAMNRLFLKWQTKLILQDEAPKTGPLPKEAEGKRKVLLIAPRFFYFAESIEKELRRQDCFVRYHADRPSEKTFVKTLIRLNRFLYADETAGYVEKIILANADVPFDDIIVILGQSFTAGMIRDLRDAFPTARMIYYDWDTVKNFPYSPRLAKAFDRAYAFEPGDVKKYPVFTYLPNFYGPEFVPRKHVNIEYDLSYVGTAYPRKMGDHASLLAKLGDQLPRRLFYFYLPSRVMFLHFKLFRKNYRHVKAKDLHIGKSLAKPSAMKVFYASRFILDYPRDRQDGLTMRVYECLGANKKLITTNKTIVDYDFYDPNNILVYDGSELDLGSDFFLKPYRPVKPEIVRSYSLASFVKRLLG